MVIETKVLPVRLFRFRAHDSSSTSSGMDEVRAPVRVLRRVIARNDLIENSQNHWQLAGVELP